MRTPETESLPRAAPIELLDIPGGITAARGFEAAGVHCGIRNSHPDLALLASTEEAAAAGVFTRNRLPAAPVVLCREHLRRSGGRARAVVVNAGNANACTGEAGRAAARETALTAGRLLDQPAEKILVCSTGVIGVPLPLERLLEALPVAVENLSAQGGSAAAEAILTTDTHSKEAAVEAAGHSRTFRVGGMAKGAGMIHPDLATTLAFVTTDAPVPADLLADALREAANRTFNRITVDGDTSTNDTVIVLANGLAGGPPLTAESSGLAVFALALEEVLRRLAFMVVADGEGATRTLEVVIRGAADEAQAVRAAKAVCGSLLVKTALHGADPNWGRIAAAVGAADVDLEPEQLAITIAGLPVLDPGFAASFDEEEAVRRLSAGEVLVEVELGAGQATGRAWTCDLTADYVEINAEYRT